jgi:hypothetical protein
LRAINGGTGLSQLQELWLGPNSSHGSLFDSREELQTAWEQNRAEVMRLWGSHGRRPMAWWEFDAGDLKHPGYDLERSTLWRAGLLTEAEKTELEHEWRAEFEKAWAPDFMLNVDGRELLTGIRARAAHLRWADVPHELVAAWTAERKHREQPASPEEVAAGAAHAGAAPEA